MSNNIAPLPQKLLIKLAEIAGTDTTINEGALSDNPLNLLLPWILGKFERRLNQGQDIELHVSSKNCDEENGAIYMIFQSPTPGFKGDVLYSRGGAEI